MIKRALLLTFLLMLLPLGLRSEVLGTAEFSIRNSNYGYESNLPLIMLRLQIGYVMPDGSFDPPCQLEFDDTRLDSTDVDTVLVAVAGDLDFQCAAEYLTDNQPQAIGVAFYLPSRHGTGYGGPAVREESEQIAFSLDSTDFNGDAITSISIRLDELTFDIIDGSFFEVIDFYCRVTVIVEGTRNSVPVESKSWGSIKSIYRN